MPGKDKVISWCPVMQCDRSLLLQDSSTLGQEQQQPQQAGEQASNGQSPSPYLGHQAAELEELPELSDEVTIDALK